MNGVTAKSRCPLNDFQPIEFGYVFPVCRFH